MKKILVFLTLFSCLFFSPTLALAQTVTGGAGDPDVKLNNPLGNDVTPQKLIGRVINAAMGLVGSLALLMFFYGGFTWMTAAGAADKVKKGKEIFIWATLGLIVIFSSYSLVKFVLTSLRG